jgi:hypothetical protein
MLPNKMTFFDCTDAVDGRNVVPVHTPVPRTQMGPGTFALEEIDSPLEFEHAKWYIFAGTLIGASVETFRGWTKSLTEEDRITIKT